MEQPLVSVITVVFNGKEFLEATILSVIKQKPFNFEYLVIDGGSTDGTVDIIRQYESYIDLWVSEPDKGIYDAMNKAIGLAKGKYLIFINAQDLLNVSLADLTHLFQKDYSIIYGQAHYVDLDGKRRLIGREVTNPLMFFESMPTCHQAIFYNKKCIPAYNLNFKIIADRVLTYEVFGKEQLSNTKFVPIPICTYYSGGYSDKHALLFIKEKFAFRKSYQQVNLQSILIFLLNYYFRYRFCFFLKLNRFKTFRRIIDLIKINY